MLSIVEDTLCRICDASFLVEDGLHGFGNVVVCSKGGCLDQGAPHLSIDQMPYYWVKIYLDSLNVRLSAQNRYEF